MCIYIYILNKSVTQRLEGDRIIYTSMCHQMIFMPMRCLITLAYIFLDNVTVVFISPNTDSICIHINQGIGCCMYVLAPILPRIVVFILIKTLQGTSNTLWHNPSRVSHTKLVYFREMKCRNAVCYGFWIISSCIFSKWSFWESETFTSWPLFEIYDGEDGTKETWQELIHRRI